MFGHQDDSAGHDDHHPAENQIKSDGVLGGGASSVTEPAEPGGNGDQNSGHQADEPSHDNPQDDNSPFVTSDSPPADDAGSAPDQPAEPHPQADASELLDIKKRALQHLSPVIDQLDQNPEEKFQTLMMMVQASDDQSLIPEAYKIAKEITNEKARAQALLDVVNEINYFTHQANPAE